MLAKVSRRTFLKRQPDFVRSDNYHNKYFFTQTFADYILTAQAGSTVGLCNKIANGLHGLSAMLGYRHLYFMGDSATPWLYREHNYPPVKRALQYLADNGLNNKFNGALQIDIAELKAVNKHLFWLVRCNGVLFSPHFTDEGFNVIGNICQYGNIHINTLNADADDDFKRALPANGLSLLAGMDCAASRISGRDLV